MSIFNFSGKKIPKHIFFLYLLPAHILKICSYKVVKRMYYSIVFRFHIIGVQVTIGRLGKYLGTKSRQQQLAESGLLEKKLYIVC